MILPNVNDFLGFNPYETEAAESFEGRQEPVSNGTYKAVATSAVRKHNKNNTGWFWELVFTDVVPADKIFISFPKIERSVWSVC